MAKARRAEIDPMTQASMLAPESTGALATSVMVELEGGFYAVPAEPPAPPTPEQTALKAEATALFLLDKASTTKRNITNMEKRQYSLKKGKVKAGTDIPTELAKLARIDEETGKPVGAIPTAQKRYSDFRQRAKIAYAESIGIETVIEPVEKMVDGRPLVVEMVRAQDRSRRDELTVRYREFDDKYGKLGRKTARNQRQEEIQASLRPEAA